MRIEAVEVRKRFGPVTALAGVSLCIPSGRRVALVGPNGSGKSTFIRAVMGMVAVEGQVLLDGVSPYAHRTSLAARLAYVPQSAPNLGATVAELVRMVADVREISPAAVVETASRLGLSLGEVAKQPVRALSGGMKQKLLLALALSTPSSLYILDEPTASLDVKTRERLFDLFAERAAGATLLLCSHRLEEIQHLVDNVVALDDGAIAFDGPVADFLGSRSRSVVAVYAPSPEDALWLEDRGFVRGARDAWAVTVSRGEKLALLREISGRLRGEADVVVRDLETLDVPFSKEG